MYPEEKGGTDEQVTSTASPAPNIPAYDEGTNAGLGGETIIAP